MNGVVKRSRASVDKKYVLSVNVNDIFLPSVIHEQTPPLPPSYVALVHLESHNLNFHVLPDNALC